MYNHVEISTLLGKRKGATIRKSVSLVHEIMENCNEAERGEGEDVYELTIAMC